jgi:hypothetical protein
MKQDPRLPLGQLPYKEGTYETSLGLKGLKRLGITTWRDYVHRVVVKFISALELDDVSLAAGTSPSWTSRRPAGGPKTTTSHPAAGFFSGKRTAAGRAARW